MKKVSTERAKRARRPDKHDQEVGRRVRARRLECDLSQTELADEIGVNFQQVQKYENGKNRMGASRLERIAKALDIPISFFFDGAVASAPKASANNPAASVFDLMQTSDAIRLVKAFHRIKPRKARQIVVQMCELFAERR